MASHCRSTKTLTFENVEKAKNTRGETPVKTGKRVGTDQEVLEFLEEFMGLVEPDGEDAK